MQNANKTQNAKRKMQNKTDRKRSPARTKRMLLILAGIALALILLIGGLILFLLKGIGGGNRRPEQDFEQYLSEKWTVFALRSWDPDAGTLELDYPLRFTYAQMEKYGNSLEELQELPEGNVSTVNALKSAAYEDCGVTLREVTVYGITTDGETAYTVWPDGTVRACWDTP